MPVQSLNALFAVKQRTQSTSQHSDRFHPCETPCLRMFNTFICVALNQVLSFSVVLNISGSPNFMT